MTSRNPIMVLHQSSLYFLLLPAACGVPVWEPYGPVMCQQECMKQMGCMSIVFKVSDLSCTLKCDHCLKKQSDLDIFCTKVSKNKNGSHAKAKIFDPNSYNTNMCEKGESGAPKRAWNRLLYATKSSESLFIIDLEDNTKQTEIYTNGTIMRISDFTDTKIFIGFLKPLGSFTLFDIESKEKTEVFKRVHVFDGARGEDDGILYLLMGTIVKTIWRVSYPLKKERVRFPDLHSNVLHLEVDPRSATFYMIKSMRSQYVYVRNFKKTLKIDLDVSWHEHCKMALDRSTYYLYILSEKRSFRIALPSRLVEEIPLFHKVDYARFYYDEFYFSVHDKVEDKFIFSKMASKKLPQRNRETSVISTAKNRILMT